ncbi:CsiV family protein [Gayadomonas joobiniege]|uniref:CsiV family protein n=1 Tax=Gayadomonas joobiniege TaxID=1234606 RepID=UPI000378C2FD|nr:CsiV family protein [Gayadomonas joobiniege]
MKKTLQAFVTVILLSLSAEVISDQRWFEIELLIFKHTAQQEAQQELFAVTASDFTKQAFNDLITPAIVLDPAQTRKLLPACNTNSESENDFYWQSILFYSDQPAWSYATFCQMPEPSMFNPERENWLALEQSIFIDKIPTHPYQKGLVLENGAYLLDPEHLELKDMYAKLRWRKDMQPLLHIAWRQPIGAEKAELPWRILAGRNYQRLYTPAGQPIKNDNKMQASSVIDNNAETLTAESEHEKMMQQVTQLTQQITQGEIDLSAAIKNQNLRERQTDHKTSETSADVWLLDGLFKIYLEHYLYIQSEFQIRKPGPHPEYLATQTQLNQRDSIAGLTHEQTFLYPYKFKQNRRIRSTEIHYFDHPDMGIILQVRRFDPLRAEAQGTDE